MTDQKNKPVLDERTFDKLLEAAYVLQEHKRKIRDLEAAMESHGDQLREQASAKQSPLPGSKPESKESSRSAADYTLTLAEVVEAQRQIQARHLELDTAMAVVADKVARITGASGAAIGILEEKTVRYRAGAGASALPLETEIPLATAICATSVRTGQVIRSEDVNTEVLFDPEPCRQRGILSLLAVPIYRDGDIVGALELYFDRVHGYAEQDIHTCQLMAGLVTEAIGRDAELKLKKSVAADRSMMLAAIERLQPSLATLAQDQSAATAGTDRGASAVAAVKSCSKCGSKLMAEEQFCGRCGAPRVTDGEPSSMQNPLASAWPMQQISEENLEDLSPHETSPPKETTSPVAAHTTNEDDFEKDNAGATLPELSSLLELEEENSDPLFAGSFNASTDQDTMTESLSSEPQLDEDNLEAPSTAIVRPRQEDEDKDLVWTSAAKARDFLESLSATRAPSAFARLLRSRRGDFYLAVAVMLMVAVIRWGVWSNHSVRATGSGIAVSGSANRHKEPAPDADLSLFDKLLIGLGLAEAPEAPEYKGNPDTQVWVDLHTALYYCPGSDLYGKTPKGKLSSQREAQLDQFEPAYRKACD
ncbi:MAG: GAF domain-containing protein [Candidatus Sulfotelmatobacter sp.]